MGHYLSELTDGKNLDEVRAAMLEAERDRKRDEQARVEEATPVVAAYLAARGEPCTIPEIEDALKNLGLDTFDVRFVVANLLREGKATSTPRLDVQVARDPDVTREDRIALEKILMLRVSDLLVSAGEKLLLCKKLYPVAEIIGLLEHLGDDEAAQKLREKMTCEGSIKSGEVQPY